MQHVERMWAGDRASAHLGMDLREVSPGRAVVTMRVDERMVNGHGICHGGLVLTLADSAFACACNAHGTTVVAQAVDAVFLDAARLGEELVAQAVERSRVGRTGVYDVTVRGPRGVVAEFRGQGREVPDAARLAPR